MKWVLDLITARSTADSKLRIDETGTLLASGLIAGEAILGIRKNLPDGADRVRRYSDFAWWRRQYR